MENQELTIGMLNANHLGRTIVIKDGGATYEGRLRKVDHSEAWGTIAGKTMISLKAGDWSHIKSYPSSTVFSFREEEDS